jgi:FtsH-binding integral membrane protein
MNKTQKEAWFGLASALLCIALCVYVIVQLSVFKRLPGVFGKFWPFGLWCLFSVISVIFLRRKQSPAEVDSDERDRLIKHRAVVACSISVWVLLAAASAIPSFVIGAKGSIPVWLLAFINLGVLLGAFLVYSAAVLLQYGRGGEGEKA